MPLNYKNQPNKQNRFLKFIKSHEEINPLMYMDDVKQFVKNEKGIDIRI